MANLMLAPKSFVHNNKKIVFIDIVEYEATLNFHEDSIEIKSDISFRLNEGGYPLFDLVQDVDEIKINKEIVSNLDTLISLPGDFDKVRYVDHEIKDIKKVHRLEIKHKFLKDQKKYVEFTTNKNGVNFYFKFCDGKGVRQLLERYLPSNMQFDQFPLKLHVNFDQQFPFQNIISNGELKVINQRSFVISYPSFYNSASFFFHTYRARDLEPFTQYYGDTEFLIYLNELNQKIWRAEEYAQDMVTNIMDELSENFGKFPHKKMILYIGEKASGIEHYGASRTSLYSIGHELFHMYFGRYVMPADGRSAWIDEGLARWRDGGDYREWIFQKIISTSINPFETFRDPLGKVLQYPQYQELPDDFTGLGKQSEYLRTTWNKHTMFDPYNQGMIFFGHIDYLMKGNLKKFLKYYIQFYGNQLYTQESFFNALYDYLCMHDQESLKIHIEGLVNKYF